MRDLSIHNRPQVGGQLDIEKVNRIIGKGEGEGNHKLRPQLDNRIIGESKNGVRFSTHFDNSSPVIAHAPNTKTTLVGRTAYSNGISYATKIHTC